MSSSNKMQEHMQEILKAFQEGAKRLSISLEQGPDGSIKREPEDPEGLEARAKREGFKEVRDNQGEIIAYVGQFKPAHQEEEDND